jgi:hypothetical protein
MAAGLGFKTFTTGEVLTAADTNGYLMQGVLVFASAAARDTAITSPQEGQFAYLKDTNVTTYYTGSAWANLDTTGMTNPMTTTGDTIYSSSGSTPARLGIGSTGQVLTVAAGIPSWATASSGSMTQLATGSFSGSSVSISSISGSYKHLVLEIYNISFVTSSELRFTFNSKTSLYGYTTLSNGTATGSGTGGVAYGSFGGNVSTYGDNVHAILTIPFYSTSAARQLWTGQIAGVNGSNGAPSASFTTGMANNDAIVITSIQLFPQTGNFNSAGTYVLYGVN